MPTVISSICSLPALTLVMLIVFPIVASAQFPSEKGGNGWTIELGFGGEWESQYAGSDNQEFEPDPYINIAWRNGKTIWYTSITDYGFYHSLTQRWLLGVSAGLEVGRDQDDDPALEGLGNIDDTWELRFDVAYRVTESVTLGARAMTAGADKENVYFVAAVFDIPTPSERLDLSLSADISWGSQQHLQTEFGVTPDQSTSSGYPAYRPASGLKSIGLGIGGNYWFTSDWFGYSDVAYEKYDRAGSRSPFAANDYDIEAEIGIGYRF